MRTYEQLTADEQDKAQKVALDRIIRAVLEGALRFSDKLNHDRLQQRIDKAIRAAEAKQTPWFAHEYIMDDKYVMEHLEGMAQCDAEDALYPDKREQIIYL